MHIKLVAQLQDSETHSHGKKPTSHLPSSNIELKLSLKQCCSSALFCTSWAHPQLIEEEKPAGVRRG